MSSRTVVHFEIPANEPERLSKFYADVLGWKFKKTEVVDMEYWTISTGPRGKSVGGGMYKRSGPEDVPRNFIGVKDIDKRIAAFKAAGGREVVPKTEVPSMGWSFIGADPESNLIALWQAGPAPRRRPAKRRK
ncbi:MAG: VOC family protein [Nitrososphaerota archaeon]|nr:VOC family protein [Nitrososphaerota archaeon]